MNYSDMNYTIEITPEFCQEIYKIVTQIPKGKVATYKQVGEKAGYPNVPREVGVAMSRTPKELGLPCHRVVNAQGTLSPEYVFGGKEAQKRDLEKEGVTFLPGDIIHMEKHLWMDHEQLSLF